jgi:hypothetical protein
MKKIFIPFIAIAIALSSCNGEKKEAIDETPAIAVKKQKSESDKGRL